MMIDSDQVPKPRRSKLKLLMLIGGILLIVGVVTSFVIWRDAILSLNLPVWKIVGIGILFLLAALSRNIFGDIYNYTKRRITHKDIYIAVVASEKSVDFPIPGEFLRGFRDASGNKTYLDTRGGKRVEIRTLEDLGSVDEAARIARTLAADKKCILVIGNSNSTLTDITLDIFLQSSNNPPPYILPIATANEIMTKAKTGNHGAVLRMVPDNASQAEVIQKLIRDLKELVPEQRVAIYGDEENLFYSINFARDIASRIRNGGGKILIEEMIGPTSSIYSSLAAWRGPNRPPEIIIFVGVAHHSLLLIDQCSELGIKVPIIFTDGCMVSALLTNVKKIENRAFVLSPVGITQKGNDQMPTYESIGKDAYNLASRIIANCNDSTRAGLHKFISINKDKEAIKMATGFAGEYHFNAEGNNIAMSYKVYEITGGELKLLTGF